MIPFMAVMLLVVLPSFVTSLSEIVQLVMLNQGILIVGSILASFAVLFLSYHGSVAAYRKLR